MREIVKSAGRVLALAVVAPQLCSYAIRARIIGRDRALEGSTQLLSLVPGIAGQYLRRAFLSRTLRFCDTSAAICFGTIFSQTECRIDRQVYVGPRCVIGRAHLERDVL